MTVLETDQGTSDAGDTRAAAVPVVDFDTHPDR
jgi:hypothetical protein